MRHFLILLAFIPAGRAAVAAEDFYKTDKRIIDSLKTVLKTQTLTDKQKLDIYCFIVGDYSAFDVDSVIVYAPITIQLAEKLNNKEAVIGNYRHLGVAYFFRNRYDSGFYYIEKTREIAIKSNDKLAEGASLSLMAFGYTSQGKYLTAIDYYLKVLDLYETIRSTDKIFYLRKTNALVNLAELYRKLDNKTIAIQYLDRASEVCEELLPNNNPLYVWKKPQVYYEYAYNYLEQDNLDKAIEYALRADSINNGVINRCNTKQALAKIYLRKGEFEKALQYATEALEQADILKDKSLYADTWMLFSDIYLAQKRYPEAETEALAVWRSDSTNIDASRKAAFNIALANVYLHNTEKAADLFKKYASLNEQYSKKGFQTTLSDLAIKYETNKKEMRITTLEKERKLYIVLGIAVVAALLLGLGLLFFRHRLSIQKQRQLEKEKELIAARSAMDAEKAEREIIARDLHDGVGAMLGIVKNNLDIMKSYSIIENKEVDYFNNALHGLEDSITELRRIAHHIMPAVLIEKGLFVALDDFCRSTPKATFIYTEPMRRFNPEKELVIYRCAYELVNNALKHSKATSIEVHLNVDDENAYLSVVDNGSGFDLQNSPQGMGIKNLHARLSAFDGKMEIFSEPGKGTEANVEVKI